MFLSLPGNRVKGDHFTLTDLDLFNRYMCVRESDISVLSQKKVACNRITTSEGQYFSYHSKCFGPEMCHPLQFSELGDIGLSLLIEQC